MKLCVFGRATDALSAHTVDVARARGHDVILVAFGELARGAPSSFALVNDAWTFRGARVDACDAFVVRRYPDVTAMLGAADDSALASEWYRRGIVQGERASFAMSCIIDMELRGKPIVNPLLSSSPYDHKPLQLATLKRDGVTLPRTLITSSRDELRDFRAAVGECIAKPVAGGAPAVVVTDHTDLAHLDAAPVIVQERVRGDDVRVTVVGDRIVSAVVVDASDASDGQVDDVVDYRARASYLNDSVRYVEHALPAAVAAMCVRAARSCHHVLSGVDLKKLKSSDDYVLLEVNSGPVYLDIERKTGAPITQAVIEHLELRVR